MSSIEPSYPQIFFTFLSCLISSLAVVLSAGEQLHAKGDQILREQSSIVSGLKLHYRVAGEGPYLLLLHGFTLSGQSWEPFITEFGRDHTVIAVDLPGHGSSDPQRGDFSFRGSAQLIMTLLDELGVREYDAIGHSAGGITLLDLAVLDSTRLRSLILVGAAHEASAEGSHLLRNDRFEQLDAGLLEFYRAIHPGGDEQIKKLFAQLNKLPDSEEWSEFTPEHLSLISAPALLVCGDSDPYFPPSVVSRLQERLADARLWVIPNQGHCPIFVDLGGSAELAGRFAEYAREFWRGLD